MFIDESGDICGDNPFYIGVLICPTAICGFLDTHITKNLPNGFGEIHGNRLKSQTIINILENIKTFNRINEVTMLNMVFTKKQKSKYSDIGNTASYAKFIAAASQAALGLHKKNTRKESINNVELVIDHCEMCKDDNFRKIIDQEIQTSSGHFKAIRDYKTLDSSASRILQVADLVTYIRRIDGINNIEERFRISLR